MRRYSWIGALLVVTSFSAMATAQRPRPQPTPTPQTPPAEPATQEDAAARLLFTTAREAFAAGNYQVALERFQQAYDLSHRSALLYNIGTTLDRMRRDREALAAFDRFLVEDPTSPNRSEVEARAAVLRAAVAEEDRQIAARAAQEEEQRLALEAARREAEERTRREAEDDGGLTPIVFISVAGGAVATGVIGLAFGIRTRSLNDDYVALGEEAADQQPGDPTPEEVRAAYDDAKSSQAIANAMLFTGAALAIGSGVLIAFTDWDGAPEEAPPTAVRILPSAVIAPGETHVGLTVRF
jgi:tetratricopeptide (TPR) repeat protein